MIPKKLHIRSALIALGMLFLGIPATLAYLLNIYQSELVKQTESELIAQSVMITEIVLQAAQIDVKDTHQNLNDPIKLDCITIDKDHFKRMTKNSSNVALLSQNSAPTTFQTPEARAILPNIDLLRMDPLPALPSQTFRPIAIQHHELALAQRIQPTIENISLALLSGVRVTNSQGIVMATSNPSAIGGFLGGREEFDAAKSGLSISLLRVRNSDSPRPESSSLSRASDTRVFVSKPIIKDGKFCGATVVSRTPKSMDQALYPKRFELFATLAVLILILSGIIWIANRTISRPIQYLSKYAIAASVYKDNTSELSPDFAILELDQLTKSIRKMASSLSDHTKILLNFTRHVGHNLRTPLTSISGATELLMTNGDTLTVDERQKLLQVIATDAKLLDSLLNDLQRYSQLEFLVKQSNQSQMKISDVLLSLERDFTGSKAQLSIAPIQEDQYVGYGPMIIAAIEQIVQNAFRHGGPQCKVAIEVSKYMTSEGQKALILISNNGRPIPENIQTRIFDPFFSTAESKEGRGMGLSIAKKIVELCGGVLELKHSNEASTDFSVSIPSIEIKS
ncbi:MAG: ATP-binding protein [Proteobacteria bacterium]|nr:ATP-binding protein [Pseudomonadota bacterium]